MLDEIKSYLDITWDDEDSNIQQIIDRGKGRLESLTGVNLDFEKEGMAKELLFEFCRYAYNNAAEFFEENFQSEILRLQLEAGVMEMSLSLVELRIEDVTLEPEFDSTITNYKAETNTETSNIKAVPKDPEADISIEIDAISLENDTEYTWIEGENVVDITVEYEGSEKTYTVVVTYEI